MTPFDYAKWTFISFSGTPLPEKILLHGHHDPHDIFPKHIQFMSRKSQKGKTMFKITAHIWLAHNGEYVQRFHDWFLSATRKELDEWYKQDPRIDTLEWDHRPYPNNGIPPSSSKSEAYMRSQRGR